MKYIKEGTFFLTLTLLFYLVYSSLTLIETPATLEAPHLPSFTDSEFKSAPLTIETFGREGCPYCLQLKETFYSNLYQRSPLSKETAARYYNTENSHVKNYFEERLTDFNLPDNLKGAVPASIINGTYLILGYSENSTSFYLDILDQIAKGESLEENPDQYLFVLKKEAERSLTKTVFPLSPSLLPLNLSLMSLSLVMASHFIYTSPILLSKQKK